jgi:hypothetical protein
VNSLKLILISFIIVQHSYSQSDSLKVEAINKLVYEINQNPKDVISAYTKHIDSIEIQVATFKNRINVISEFSKEDRLITNMFLRDGEVIFISFVEPSAFNKNNPDKNINEYYYYNNRLIKQNSFIELSSFSTCVPMPPNKNTYDYYGFNKNFTNSFYLRYIDKLKDSVITE